MMPAMLETVLIANRGEIACRIIATCRRLGIRTVAVYSDVDADSRHVRLADQAIRIGSPPARESYLVIDRILDAARRTNARAIHPGYGFLSENADFAEACLQAGIVFIGPPPSAIRTMGSKAAAKILLRKAGVPMIPGYDGPNQSPEYLSQQAESIGYPVMIKANAGGGGKGMRRIDASVDFPAALASCKREAAAAFGDDSVLIEKCLVQPRHVEVQIFADTYGNIVSLFERDCSVQRRHQKVIEESPAPLITSETRQALGTAAREAARSVGYVNAGTVEFLMDREGAIYFMEMNTRLQVEHPVTEMITGLDLVEWQLRVAAGERLPLAQNELVARGHSIETRIYAEDPANEFMPSIGTLVHLKMPEPTKHVRIDTGVEQGDAITPYYDPMIAKLIVWDETRELALERLDSALAEYQIVGVASNVGFLRRLVTSSSFVAAALDTSLIDREHAWLYPEFKVPPDTAIIIAALAVLLSECASATTGEGSKLPWSARDGWRLYATYTRTLVFTQGHRKYNASVEYLSSNYRIGIGQASYFVSGKLKLGNSIVATINGQRLHATAVSIDSELSIFITCESHELTFVDPLAMASEVHAKDSSLLAPMPGRVVTQLVEPGVLVEIGASLLVLEAMKMECTIHAPSAGRVQSFLFAAGDQVTEGAELLRFDPEDLREEGK
jgi:3-methylcrotonyl-CoA carboxylase alpha subunit